MQKIMRHHVSDSSYELLFSTVDKNKIWKFVFALFPSRSCWSKMKYLAITINPIDHISCWRVDTVYGRSPWATVCMILVEAPSGLVPNCGPTTPVYITTPVCEHCIRVCSIGNHNPLEGICLCRIRSEENSNPNNNQKIMPGSGIVYHISSCHHFSELKYNL